MVEVFNFMYVGTTEVGKNDEGAERIQSTKYFLGIKFS